MQVDLASELVVRLRKPEDEKRWVWKLTCHAGLIVALKGKKPKERSGSQPEESALYTLKSAEAYKRIGEQ